MTNDSGHHDIEAAAGGRDAGGTGHTLRVAAVLGIPVVILSRHAPPERNAAASSA